MKFSTPFRTICCLLLSVLMSHTPALASAEAKMISTNVVVHEMSREQNEQKMRDLINREDVKKALLERGISPQEVSQRLASLDDQELRQLSGQVEQARAGGTILVEILIVVLIIYLIRRM